MRTLPITQHPSMTQKRSRGVRWWMAATTAVLCCSSVSLFHPQPSQAQLAELENGPEIELLLTDLQAFGVGTAFDVNSVEPLDPTTFNQLLLTSHRNQAIWVNDPLWVGLQFLQFINQPLTGSQQTVSVFIPGEWEQGQPFDFARVTVEDKGWLDDSTLGERHVLWLVQGDEGEMVVQRVLRSNLCSRPLQTFYAQSCL